MALEVTQGFCDYHLEVSKLEEDRTFLIKWLQANFPLTYETHIKGHLKYNEH